MEDLPGAGHGIAILQIKLTESVFVSYTIKTTYNKTKAILQQNISQSSIALAESLHISLPHSLRKTSYVYSGTRHLKKNKEGSISWMFTNLV